MTTWAGRWRLVETDLWGEDSIDLLEPAYIEFGAQQLGNFVVGALQAGIDYRVGERDGRPIVEFSWVGDDDGHDTSGRGWAQLDSTNAIRVKLFIHQGDEVLMSGVRAPSASPRRSKQRSARTRRPRR